MSADSVTSPRLSSRAGSSPRDDKRSASRAGGEKHGWGPLAGSVPGCGRLLSAQQDGAFGAELAQERRWVRRGPGTPAISQPRRFGAGRAAPGAFAPPGSRRRVFENHHLNQPVLPARRPPRAGTAQPARAAPRHPHRAGRDAGSSIPLPARVVLPGSPSAPSLSPHSAGGPSGAEPSAGAVLPLGGGVAGAGRAEQAPRELAALVRASASEMKAGPRGSLGAAAGNSPAGARRGPSAQPRIPVCSGRSRSKAPGARGEGARPRSHRSKPLTAVCPGCGDKSRVRGQIPALVPGTNILGKAPPSSLHPPSVLPPSSLPASPRARSPPAPSPSAPRRSHQQWRGHPCLCFSCSSPSLARAVTAAGGCHGRVAGEGTPGWPSDRSVGAADGHHAAAPRLRQPSWNHEPPGANSSPESGQGHCCAKEPFSP